MGRDFKGQEILIFHRGMDLPPMQEFAMGCFNAGWIPTLLKHSEFDGRECSAVAVGGQPTRYDGMNGKIVDYYRHHGGLAFYIEGGWLYEPRVPRYWLTYLNNLPYCPDFECPDDRRKRLKMEAKDGPRGDDILIVGQMPETDAEMDRVFRDIRRYTDRKIIYRPRQTSSPFYFGEYDELSINREPEEDLDRAFCVITPFSFMGAEALMRGIPVICDPGAAFAEFGQNPLNEIEELEPPNPDAVNKWLNRLAYIMWNAEEFKNGEAFQWLLTHAVAQYPTSLP